MSEMNQASPESGESIGQEIHNADAPEPGDAEAMISQVLEAWLPDTEDETEDSQDAQGVTESTQQTLQRALEERLSHVQKVVQGAVATAAESSLLNVSNGQDLTLQNDDLLGGPLGGENEMGHEKASAGGMCVGAEWEPYSSKAHPGTPSSADVQEPTRGQRPERPGVYDAKQGASGTSGVCQHFNQSVRIEAQHRTLLGLPEIQPETPEADRRKEKELRASTTLAQSRHMVSEVGYAEALQCKSPGSKSRSTRSMVSESSGKRDHASSRQLSASQKCGSYVSSLPGSVVGTPETNAPEWSKERSNLEQRAPELEGLSKEDVAIETKSKRKDRKGRPDEDGQSISWSDSHPGEVDASDEGGLSREGSLRGAKKSKRRDSVSSRDSGRPSRPRSRRSSIMSASLVGSVARSSLTGLSRSASQRTSASQQLQLINKYYESVEGQQKLAEAQILREQKVAAEKQRMAEAQIAREKEMGAREKETAQERLAMATDRIAREKETAQERVDREKETAQERVLRETMIAEAQIAREKETAQERVDREKEMVARERETAQERLASEQKAAEALIASEQRVTEALRQDRSRERKRAEQQIASQRKSLERLYQDCRKQYEENMELVRDKCRRLEGMLESKEKEPAVAKEDPSSNVAIFQQQVNEYHETAFPADPDDTEEPILSPANILPVSSSVLSLISKRRRCSDYSSESSEDSVNIHSDSDPGLPVLSSGSSILSSQSTGRKIIDTAKRTTVSKDRGEKFSIGAYSDTAMDEYIEGLQLYGGDAEPAKTLFRSLLQVDSSAGRLDEKAVIVPDGRSKRSKLVPSEGEMTASASSVEAMSSVMSTTFLRTLDQLAKMAEVTSDAVLQLKRRPIEPIQRVRSSVKKRLRKACQCSVSTQRQIRDLEITLRTTVESLTMTQRRLDEAESQLREGAAIIRELEENPQSWQQNRSSGEHGCVGRRFPLAEGRIEERNPSCFASYPENVAGRVDIRAASSPVSSRSTAENLANAGEGPHVAAIELRRGSATQQKSYLQHDVFPAIQGEAGETNTTNQQDRLSKDKLRRYSWTLKGTPVCWTCQKEGHMRKQCNISRQQFQESVAFQPEVAQEKSKIEALEVLQERRQQLEIATSRQLKIVEEKPKIRATKPLQERPVVAYGPKRGLISTEVEIRDKRIFGVVDTGSEVTLIHEEAALCCIKRKSIKPSGRRFKDAAGNDMNVRVMPLFP